MRCADVFAHAVPSCPWLAADFATVELIETTMHCRVLRLPVVTVRVAELWATQPTVYRKYVERWEYRERTGSVMLVDSEPAVVRWAGRLWVYDGHHHCTLALLRGDQWVHVRLFDADVACQRRAA